MLLIEKIEDEAKKRGMLASYEEMLKSFKLGIDN